ncbi:MAG: hypothetical protein PHU04_00430 [Candidatus Peribacteraceae bacterium]|nr:hypothetical protein [Candidatus Peribacteraceae bacterium]
MPRKRLPNTQTKILTNPFRNISITLLNPLMEMIRRELPYLLGTILRFFRYNTP